MSPRLNRVHDAIEAFGGPASERGGQGCALMPRTLRWRSGGWWAGAVGRSAGVRGAGDSENDTVAATSHIESVATTA